MAPSEKWTEPVEPKRLRGGFFFPHNKMSLRYIYLKTKEALGCALPAEMLLSKSAPGMSC